MATFALAVKFTSSHMLPHDRNTAQWTPLDFPVAEIWILYGLECCGYLLLWWQEVVKY
jgi:hypothetical protein